jgi:hypothetical protein
MATINRGSVGVRSTASTRTHPGRDWHRYPGHFTRRYRLPMQHHHPILVGGIEARDGSKTFVYGDAILGRDPETGELVVLAGRPAVVELVDRLHRVAAVELVTVEAIALAILLLTADFEEES